MGPSWERRIRERVGVREGPGEGCDDAAVRFVWGDASREALTRLKEPSPSKDWVDCLLSFFFSISAVRDSLDRVRFLPLV